MKYQPWLKHLPVIAGGLFILIVAIMAFVFRDYFAKPTESKKQVQQISVVRPPPPPPPPPPKPEIKPPEVKEEVKTEEPEPEPEPEPEAAPDAEPPGDQLGVDSDGSAGGDGFGLVGKKGGAGLIGGGGGGGNAIIWYGQHVARELTSELSSALKDRPRQSKYSAVVLVWISPDGNISKVELAHSSGTPEIDEALRAAISRIQGRFKPPPERMPQPLKVRIRS